MSRLVLIDAHSIIHRAYHAVPPLTTTKGELVNAVYGFASTLLKVFAELRPDYVAVAIDLPGPTFRHEKYKEYKATRKETDEALSSQFEKTNQILDAFNIPYYGIEGFEADDLLGTLSEKAVSENKKVDEVIIVTGDKDALQLVDAKIKVYMPARTLADTVIYDEKRFQDRFGFEPEQLIDFKALAGDSSDNVPGVRGVGEVTATKLVQEFSSIENIYKNLDKIPEKIRGKLEDGKDDAIMSKQLVTILKNIPIELDLEKCRLKDFDQEKLVDLFEKFEFKSLISRLQQDFGLRLDGVEPSADTVGGKVPPPETSKNGEEKSTKTTVSTDDLDEKLKPVLDKMSATGVLVDGNVLTGLGKQFSKRLGLLEKQIYKSAGHEFNLNSPKQLSHVLYSELHLPVVKKTKTGLSTDEGTLTFLKGAHPMIPFLLEYRELFKLKSTYIDALPKYIDKKSRIHSEFRLDVAATGRLSSQNPNLQNIPIRGEWGAAVRSAFVAPKAQVLLSADYSQIELRIMAHISGDLALKKAFEEGLDIHDATAAQIFDKPISEVKVEDRRMAKILNFGLMFGLSAHGLSVQLGIEYAHAAKLLADYFARFPKVADYMEETINEAKEKGYVETLGGKRRYIPELSSANAHIRAAGERMAISTPIQGSEADIIKQAMIDIDQAIVDKRLATKLILQVHDELLFEIPESELKTVTPIIKDKMENAYELSVPIVVDLKIGKNWGEMEVMK